MLVDEVFVRLEAGKGGKGAVAFQKVRLMQGPTGGDGGRGGSVYFEGVSDMSALAFFSGKKIVRGQDGGDGRGQFVDGKGGDDVILRVPAGTRIVNVQTGFAREVGQVGDRVLGAGGGKGGRGNFKFRSSTNTTPMESEEGTPGDTIEYRLELRLIADIGLVGLPNAGKSSLLNTLTNAKSRVGAYAFTTLEPHLGDHYGTIIADIPGLIEGASVGKGLGTKFLKHIERTATLFHLVSAESEDVAQEYRAVRAELAAYSPELAAKPEHVFLTKSDMVTPEELAHKIAALARTGVSAMPVSILDDASIEAVRVVIRTIKADHAKSTSEA